MTSLRQTTVTITHGVPVDDDHPLRIAELARAAGDREEWVLALVDAGLIAPTRPDAPQAQWVFHGEALRCALQARRLQRDFDVGVEAAALIIDLQREVRRLRALLGG
ncbi:chaperone modulator CbpM [Xenophilus sp. Marseille-Q4582]|uniref:chaperone modulator CbpM n=1 Tax=Xenophilus sp. Marseille-Q4582 TaxID=2866600 RepID=UPI001CE40A35|nr:chaperone modulator CbpM [Xenophilus sp. Marseille-Q4582]